MNLIFFGAPGVGKGTQAAMLAEKLGVPHLSTGAVIRRAMEEETELGRKAKGYYDRGALVPDELVTQIVVEALDSPELSGGFILDGYPRNTAQAADLQNALGERDRSVDRVVYLTAPDDEITRRMLARGRADDTEEVIVNRLRVYAEETAPLLDHYNRLGLVSEVDGVGELDEVHDRIVAAVSVSSNSDS